MQRIYVIYFRQKAQTGKVDICKSTSRYIYTNKDFYSKTLVCMSYVYMK